MNTNVDGITFCAKCGYGVSSGVPPLILSLQKQVTLLEGTCRALAADLREANHVLSIYSNDMAVLHARLEESVIALRLHKSPEAETPPGTFAAT